MINLYDKKGNKVHECHHMIDAMEACKNNGWLMTKPEVKVEKPKRKRTKKKGE